MQEQRLIKKIEDQAKIFKSRAVKSLGDLKRHDRVRQDEKKSMWIAHNQLGWSFVKIGGVFGRDPRTTKEDVESYKPIERAAQQKPYVETRHKWQIREMAAKVASTLDLPSAFDSFIVELKPGRLFLGHIRLPINISETGELEVEIRFEGHLYEGLHNHLNTGGFSKVLDQIESWKEEVAGNLLACHKLFTLVKAEVEESYNASIPMDYQGQPGFTLWFPITICSDAIEQARGVTYITDSWYKYEGSDLRCGAFLIYKGTPDEDLGVYRNAHIALRAKYAEDEQAKERARQRDLLYQIRDKIGQELQKFIDMEHLPGQCELCFHSSPFS